MEKYETRTAMKAAKAYNGLYSVAVAAAYDDDDDGE